MLSVGHMWLLPCARKDNRSTDLLPEYNSTTQMQRTLVMMSRKKILLVFLAVSSVSFLLHQGGHLTWNGKPFHVGCSSFRHRSHHLSKTKHANIVFLKTHKTASTTVQNILFRFAERHNLTVALPIQACDHQFCYPRAFSSHFVHPHTMPAQVVTSHMRFNRSELQKFMPNDTLYITILREPTAMFESLFSYYNQYCLSFKRVPNGSLETFLADPHRYYRSDEKYSMYAHNTLLFDLGGNKDHNPLDGPYISAFIKEMEEVFSLVMISEYFDESLILLRHLLSWDLEDMLYVKLNMRTPESKFNLSSDLPSKIRKWNALDAKIYDYFNATFWKKLHTFGLNCVQKEVELLREAQDKLVRGCFGGGLPQLRSAAQIKNKELRPWQPSSKVDIVGYDLPSNISRSAASDPCLKLIMPEVQYTHLLLKSQSIRYRKKYPLRTPLVNSARAVRHHIPRSSSRGSAVPPRSILQQPKITSQ
ncbi:galactose-3-O-sulfotransferase 3 isoform X2 [Polypterus senegalus]|nr:galactose-3-O-sulfotransferase 3 isoform X2 [Polypterus senegalus]XP_039625231.1 galactose-3-O-sulfotransferase 3 isoform X2 [Polypterus senegalus]